MLVLLYPVDGFRGRKTDQPWGYINVFIMSGNIGVCMMNDIMADVPDIRTGTNQVKYETEYLINDGVGG
ncbi:hypothetical protein D3C85_1044480 [compost metagenome]